MMQTKIIAVDSAALQPIKQGSSDGSDLIPDLCPFCGYEARLIDQADANFNGEELARLVFVECQSVDCGATGPRKGCQSDNYVLIDSLPKMAIESWNHRAR